MVGYTTASSMPRSCHVRIAVSTTGESTGVFAGSTPCRSTTLDILETAPPWVGPDQLQHRTRALAGDDLKSIFTNASEGTMVLEPGPV